MTWPGLVANADAALLAVLGVGTTYVTGAGVTAQPKGIFTAAYVRVEAGHAGVSSQTPAVFYRLVDLPSDPDEDEPTITIDGVSYAGREVEKNGQGGVYVLLTKVR